MVAWRTCTCWNNDELEQLSTGTLALSATGLVQPAHGTATVKDNGTPTNPADDYIEYRPNADFFSLGADTFTYTALDGLGHSDTAVVTVTVATDDGPIANPDEVVTEEDPVEPISILVLANDLPLPRTALSVAGLGANKLNSITTVQGGTATIATDGKSVSYMPRGDFFGTDSFTYFVSDGALTSLLPATVTVAVRAVNDIPVANADSAVVLEDTLGDLTTTDVLGNVQVLDNDRPGPATVIGSPWNEESQRPNMRVAGLGATMANTITTAKGAEVTISTDGKSVRYLPRGDFFGTDSFTYYVSDSAVTSLLPATVTVEVTSVNDAPLADDDFVSVDDEPIENVLNVLDNDFPGPTGIEPPYNEDDQQLTIMGLGAGLTNTITTPQGGTATISVDKKTILYTPLVNFQGDDEFTYTISDGQGGFDAATVFVTVQPAALPKARRDSYVVAEDSEYADETNRFSVLDNDDKNPTANWLPIIVVPTTDFPDLKAPQHGTVRVSSDSRIEYKPDLDYFGPDSFEYVIDDDFVGSAPAKGLVVIFVASVNDAPELTVPGAQSVNEDTLLSITGISVADVDAATGTVKITMSITNGRLTLSQVTGLTFTVGDGTSDAAMTFAGTLANINSALARVDYVGNTDFSGADTLSVTVDDQANTGSGGAKTDSKSVAITVSAVNDAPVLTVPGAQSANEDTLLSITGISVSDVDAATGAVKITMSVASGRLTLAQTAGLTFTVGDGTSDAAMTFSGTLANVNLAVARVDYLGNANYVGADSLSVSVDDQANTGTGGAKTDSKSIAITVSAVNDAPVLTVPGAQSVNEDTLLSIAGISVADIDVATGAVKITMSVASGRLTLAQITGLTFTVGDGTSDAAMTFTGTVADINLALARVDYLSNTDFSGVDSLSVSVDDQSNTGTGGAKTDTKSVAITVSAVNDAPALTVPSAQTVNEDTVLSITGISVADVDAAAGAVKITMSVASGRITLAQTTGLTFTVGDGTSDAAMTFTGTLANVNLALARVDYLGNANYVGADSLSVSVDDQANTGTGGAKTDSKSIAITVSAVNDAPVLTVPGAQSVNEDTLLSITGISVADVDVATGAVKITMSVANGRLTLAQITGLTFTVGDGTSDAAMTFTGTVANINLALARVDYLSNTDFNGVDSLSVSVDDQSNTGSGGAKTDTKSVAITVSAVNDAPVLTVPSAQTINEDTVLSITGISVADVDAATGAVKIAMSVASGRITLAQTTGLTFTVGDGTNDAAMTFTGTLANVNLALARVDYLGNANYVGADSLSVSVDDQANTGTGGAKTDSKSVTITVSAVNDAPVLTVPGAQAVNEDTLLSITGISVADVDVATGAVKITMSVANGRLTLCKSLVSRSR